MSSYSERQLNLGLAGDVALDNFFRKMRRGTISERQMEQIYSKFFSLIRRHVNEYIKPEPDIELKRLYYGEVINAIGSFISSLKKDFPKETSEDITALFSNVVINPLDELIAYYSNEREKAAIPTAVATPIVSEAVAEFVSVPTAQPRFQANTNVRGFVSQFRDFVGGTFNRLNNNPIPEAQSLEPKPPTEGQPTNFRRGAGGASGGGV